MRIIGQMMVDGKSLKVGDVIGWYRSRIVRIVEFTHKDEGRARVKVEYISGIAMDDSNDYWEGALDGARFIRYTVKERACTPCYDSDCDCVYDNVERG